MIFAQSHLCLFWSLVEYNILSESHLLPIHNYWRISVLFNMHLREYLNITYNVNCLWHLCEKKVIRSEIKCSRCKKILIFNSVENKILHCTAKYYKTIKGRKRQKLTCNFKISIFHGLYMNVYTQTFLKYVNLSHILEMSILRHNSSTSLSIYYE